MRISSHCGNSTTPSTPLALLTLVRIVLDQSESKPGSILRQPVRFQYFRIQNPGLTHPPAPPPRFPPSSVAVPCLQPTAAPRKALKGRGSVRLARILILLYFFPAALRAQAPAPPTIPALFLSDIHLDPYADPAKVPRLAAAPAAAWPAILAEPDSPTRAADSAALQAACPVRGTDTPNTLWQSSLKAIHSQAANARFVTLGGDLLAHQFDCKFKNLLPAATQAEYLAFVDKTLRYIVTGLRASLPGVPLYIALGNNDSGCTDYALDPTRDAFLAQTAKIIAEALPEPDRAAVLRDFPIGGYYSVPLAAIPHTRILVLDDVVSSTRYNTCAGKPDPAPAAAQLAWLDAQLSAARNLHERVWVLGHIPPGVDLYATTRKLTNLCTDPNPQMFLASQDLADTLASYPDVIRLALFGHTHSDEMRLLRLKAGPSYPGVPVKLVASITAVNGNNPSFTLARIDPATAALVDYTVILASNQTGIGTTWSPEYTFSSAYHKPAFDSASLTQLIAGFRADPNAQKSASQLYLDNYAPRSSVGALLKFVWPQYVCSMDQDSAIGFSACACATAK